MTKFHVITGGMGFIGSAVVWEMNNSGIDNLIIVDSPSTNNSWKNLVNIRFADIIDKNTFIKKIEENKINYLIEGIIHMGACADTTENRVDYLLENNFQYTKKLATWAINNNCRFLYASSAATYGNGPDFADDEEKIYLLKPLNIYGYSKHLFDIWAYRNNLLKQIAGIKFFNVFGPNEYHKGEMRSVIHKKFYEIMETGKANLFKSYKPQYKDGEQKRDFIYIKDAVKIIMFIYKNKSINGIFNAGTGIARSFNDIAKTIFSILGKKENIQYIDMPENIRNSYQYFTQADVKKIRSAGYKETFLSLEESIQDYIKNYLLKEDPYLKPFA
ncbi:MAG TPA: ADP-glyceromanno-heptose 6-epimerase [Candidatus Ratteibacteria bacterium]|nr:ADP-glyceromanno-heptose 6-epimerase [bacterium]HON05474.1 ADP-glyceromanno-heptose 6-epimerase [bacterium]HPC28593.1 ADP-glyceromanno-heptose 6-epimerase [bacterium]HRS05942.1 ADP-glyceromanno-heptose 6-epimerase [Candidatus Ratteibacteria bacterium]HRV04422.1 ADP-glyceromanno-heptose 6-epimerase [Candidatus Ratteibacteria bacterium]